jgi:heptosyltransferase-3
MMRTMLVIHAGALGDVLLSRPVLRALKQVHPSDQLGLLCGKGVGELLKLCGEVDVVFPVESAALAQLFSGPDAVSSTVREFLARCDRVIAWTSDPDGTLRATLAAFGIRLVRVESAVESTGSATAGMHQSSRLCGALGGLPDKKETITSLTLPSSLHVEGRRHLDRYLTDENVHRPLAVVHPGSGSRHKCISARTMSAVLCGLRDDGMVPLLVQGPSDDSQVQALLELCSVTPAVIRHLSVVELAGVLAHADLVIGHDSGVSHLAASLGRPTVALFGPTDPRRWGPRGAYVRILSGDACRCGTWEEVRTCQEKMCLPVDAGLILAACREMRKPSHASPGAAPHLVLPGCMC